MRKKRLVPLIIAALSLALLLAGCNGAGSGSSSGSLPNDNLPEHWSASGDDFTFDGQGFGSYWLSGVTLTNQDYRYSADVIFSDPSKGLAALVFQSSADQNNCYEARISAMTNRAELYKIENGLEIPLGIEVGLEDKDSYRLQINMVDYHIAFFVDDTLICSTGDYMVVSDIGQSDVLLSGQLGLYGSGSEITFQNTRYTVYEEGTVPALTSLSILAQSGSVEDGSNRLGNGWYVYQQYVSADCDAVTIQAEAPDGVDAVVLSDTGEVINGAASLRTGQNNFQILTRTSEESGGENYQLSYRLNILRQGSAESVPLLRPGGLGQRPQRPDEAGGHLAYVLPVLSRRNRLGHHALGPRLQHRPDPLGGEGHHLLPQRVRHHVLRLRGGG